MSNNNKTIVFASILGAILAIGLLALNPSTITNAQAIPYDSEDYDDRHSYSDQYEDDNYYRDGNKYSYDNNHQKKSSYGDIQKIKCVNSNINVNGIDITQIPRDDTATRAAANEGGAEGAYTQNGNGLVDRIDFDRNLVNICVNVNDNEQVKVSPPEEQTCENCFSILSEQDLEGFLMIFDQTVDSATGEEIDINTVADLCEFLETSTVLSSSEKFALLSVTLNSQGVSDEDEAIILQCLRNLGTVV